MRHIFERAAEVFARDRAAETAHRFRRPVEGGLAALVAARIADYVAHFTTQRAYDIYHAGDGLSGAALAHLKAAGRIPGFVRTVHHIDEFSHPRLAAWQEKSIVEADAVLTVSDLWHSPKPDGREPQLRQRFGLGNGPIFLSVGGVEARKNSLALLGAFIETRRVRPEAQLIIAGGASLLDHQPYRRLFFENLRLSGLPDNAVIVAGPLPEADMPALYRLADALVFPSLNEGFGLVVLEAMASGVPAVVSWRRPFTDYLSEAEAVWCDPDSSLSIAGAMLTALAPPVRRHLAATGRKVAARHDWRQTAKAHLPVYLRLLEIAHA